MGAGGFQIVSFATIKHKLPKDCWAVRRNEKKGGEFETSKVLYQSGDMRLVSLDLDDPLSSTLPSDRGDAQGVIDLAEPDMSGEQDFAKPDALLPEDNADNDIFLLFVEGNLVVERCIGNEETDGAAGLIVLGDLTASNMIVGGQEIYVAGTMRVSELFWGDYNHGTLIVKGDATAKMFADTDEYHVEIAGKRDFAGHISNWDMRGHWQDLDMMEIDAIFDPEFILHADGMVLFDRRAMLKHCSAGKSVFFPERMGILDGPDIPSRFPDAAISLDTVEQLTLPSLLLPSPEDEASHQYEFWSAKIFCRATSYSNAEIQKAFKVIYLQGPEHAIRLRAEFAERPRKLWERLMGRALRREWLLARHMRMRKEDDAEWQILDPASPEPALQLCHDAWTALLDGVSTYEYARKLISPHDIAAILTLPLVAPYNDYYDDEKNGFWAGDLYCAFRQEGALFEGEAEPLPALVKVARTYFDAAGEERLEAYFYELRRHQDGSECVFIRHKTNDGDATSARLNFTGSGKELKIAVRLFQRIKARLLEFNARLLDGNLPVEGEDFALEYWRAKGYL